MIYGWLIDRYKGELGEAFPDVVCLGPIQLSGQAGRIALSPGVILAHPPKGLLLQLMSCSSNTEREKLIVERSPVVISDGVIVGPNTVLYDGVTLANEVFLEGRCMVRQFASLGRSSKVYFGAYIGENVRIGDQCKIAGLVCNNSEVGEGSAVFGKLVHKYPRPGLRTEEPSPVIEENVLVGVNAIVIGGIRIGANARIAAGALVIGDVPGGELVTGLYTSH